MKTRKIERITKEATRLPEEGSRGSAAVFTQRPTIILTSTTREMITIISLLTSAPKLTDVILSSQIYPIVTFDHLQVHTDEMTLISLQSEHL